MLFLYIIKQTWGCCFYSHIGCLEPVFEVSCLSYLVLGPAFVWRHICKNHLKVKQIHLLAVELHGFGCSVIKELSARIYCWLGRLTHQSGLQATAWLWAHFISYSLLNIEEIDKQRMGMPVRSVSWTCFQLPWSPKHRTNSMATVSLSFPLTRWPHLWAALVPDYSYPE